MARWVCESSEAGPDLIIFRARFDRMRHPGSGKCMRAVVLESPDWVNVVAVTKAGRIVVVDQHRFGCGADTLEIPAGIVDPGEEPLEAAKRELREETGYASSAWEYLGWVEPNPAFLDNRCHHWLARDAEKAGPPRPDDTEAIEVREMEPAEVLHELHEGRMRHALAVSALSHVMDLRTAKGGDR